MGVTDMVTIDKSAHLAPWLQSAPSIHLPLWRQFDILAVVDFLPIRQLRTYSFRACHSTLSSCCLL